RASDRPASAASRAAASGPGLRGDARPPDRASARAAMRKRTGRRPGSRFELRDDMISVSAGVEVPDRPHRAAIKLAIEMREQLIVARTLPAQRLAQGVDVHLDQKQPGLAEKMLPRGLGDLGGGREMDKTVAGIVGAAAVHALPLSLPPGGSGT